MPASSSQPRQDGRDGQDWLPPHLAILKDSIPDMSVSVTCRPGISEYIPTAWRMFHFLEVMCNKVHDVEGLDSTKFFSPLIYLYYSHVVYHQILRARQEAGALSKAEKGALAIYSAVRPLEGWPIAGPLRGFVQALGAHKPADSCYSWVVPKLPDFSPLDTFSGLANLHKVVGMSRLPVIPAIQQLVYNCGNGRAKFDEHDVSIPIAINMEYASLLEINNDRADNHSFMALSTNLCWREPAEVGPTAVQDVIPPDALRACVSHYGIPSVGSNATLNATGAFLFGNPELSPDWMRGLLAVAATFNEFFPDSSNLLMVPPTTTLGSLTHVTFINHDSPELEVGDENRVGYWYHRSRRTVRVDFQGFSSSAEGQDDTRVGVATATNAEFVGFLPALIPESSASPARTGPFFEDAPDADVSRKRSKMFLTKGTADLPCSEGEYGRLIEKYSVMKEEE